MAANEIEITVMRKSFLYGWLFRWGIFVDGKKVAAIKNGGIVQLIVPNGEHTIKVENSNTLAFSAEGENIIFDVEAISRECTKLTSISKFVKPVPIPPAKPINWKEFYSISNICAYIVILALCSIPFQEDIKNCFILKFDDANKEILEGEITSIRYEKRYSVYYFSFAYNKELKTGSFEISGISHILNTFNLGDSYSKGDKIKLLYNKEIDFAYSEEELLGNIISLVFYVIAFSLVLIIIYAIIKNSIVNKQPKTENKENTK